MLQILESIDPTIVILLFLSGLFIGLISSMVGIGGGLLNVPILILIFDVPAFEATSISIFCIIFTSSTGAFIYSRQKRIDLRTGIYFVLFAVPSAFIGGIVAKSVDTSILTITFGLLMLVVAFRKILAELQARKNNSVTTTATVQLEEIKSSPNHSFIPKKIEQRLIIDSDGEKFRYDVRLRAMLVGAAFGGFIAGLLGVGGGVVYVPLLNSLGGIPPHIAVATSTFTIVFSALSGSLSRILLGDLPADIWQYIPGLALGSIIGARFGATRVKKVSSEKVLVLFYIIVFISGIRTIAKGLGWF